MAKDDCPVQFAQPPAKLEYGALEIIGQENQTQFSKGAKGSKQRKHPRGIQLPHSKRSESAERILEAPAARQLGELKVGHDPVVFPGWLIQLSDASLNSLMNVKNILTSGRSFCEVLEDLVAAVDNLALGVPRSDIVEVLRRTPYVRDKWSFSHFLMGLGNPTLAREKGVFQPPVGTSEKTCRDNADEDMADGDSRPDAPRTYKQQQEAANRLHRAYDVSKEDNWPSRRKTDIVEDETDITGYSMREKIFYSGLLIFEMYGTMAALEELYFQSDNIPLPRDKFLKLQARRGFGTENIGTRKPKFAEWDRPLPPPPKQSPYLDSFSLVATRWKIQKPNVQESLRKKTLTTLQPLHLLIKAPNQERQTIKVTENRDRIKRAMEYLASTGNCVAMLPNSHYIIHLSDTFLQKLEEININAVSHPLPPKYNPSTDMADILHEASKLYLPHGIPCQIAKMRYLLPFNCAISLRKIAEHVRKQHWEYIDQQYKLFRNIAWDLMHVDRIPCGQLRNNFIYAFDAYLPPNAFLPMGFSGSNNPWD